MNRVEKIKLLKALQDGKASVNDLFPFRLLQRFEYDDKPTSYYIGGTKVSKENYKMELQQPGEKINIIRREAKPD